MSKCLMTAIFLSMAFVPVAPLWAQEAGGVGLHKDAIDTNGDGFVSDKEAQTYLANRERAAMADNAPEAEGARAPVAVQPAVEGAAAPVSVPAAPVPVAEPVVAMPPPVVAEEPKEMERMVTDAPANDQKKLDKRIQEMKTLDLNNDGILQASELQQSAGHKFDAADTNKDGVISSEEAAAAIEQFQEQQGETYGKAVVKQEAGRIKNRLKNADANRDGQISKEEYEAFMNERQSLFDRNGDGIISEDEYRTDGEKLPSTYRKKKTRE